LSKEVSLLWQLNAPLKRTVPAVYYIDACFTKTVAPVEQSKHIAHSQCDVTKTIRIHRYPKHLFQNREDLFFMKNKTKVVLGLAAMLAGTAAVSLAFRPSLGSLLKAPLLSVSKRLTLCPIVKRSLSLTLQTLALLRH
jgi:hypothetical protein